MNIKPDVLKRKINELPVCSDGKKKIEELFSEAFGIKFKTDNGSLLGKVVITHDNKEGIVIATGKTDYIVLLIDKNSEIGHSGGLHSLEREVFRKFWFSDLTETRVVADSIEEYYKNKAKS